MADQRRHGFWNAIPAIREAAGDDDHALGMILDLLDGVLTFRGRVPVSTDAAAALSEPLATGAFAERAARLVGAYAAGGHATDPTPAALMTDRATRLQGAISSRSFDRDAVAADHMRWHRGLLGSSEWLTDWRDTDDAHVSAIVLHFDRAEPVATDTMERFRLLCGHLRHAERLAARQAFAGLDRAAEAMFVVDHRMRAIHVNAIGERMLADGDALRLIGRRLSCSDPGAMRSLSERVAAAAIPLAHIGERFVTIPRRRSPLPHLVGIDTIHIGTDVLGVPRRAACIRVVNRDTAPPRHVMDGYRDLFGLTEAEMRVAGAMMTQGGNLREIALLVGISYHTTRTHVARLLAKTGTSTQAALVRLLARLD